MKIKLLIIIVLLFLSPRYLIASSDYFGEGLIFFNKNELDKAKFKFEQDLVFNPKMKIHIYTYLKYSINKKKKI